MIEPIDEVAIQNLQTYKEKKFVDISKEDLELGLFFPPYYLVWKLANQQRILFYSSEKQVYF